MALMCAGEELVESNGGKGRLHVLIVEDNPDCASSLALLLRRYGFTVDLAADGPGALSAVAASPPDAALLDIGLPGEMDGWELAKRIKAATRPRQPLLIAVSGFGREDDRHRSTVSGIDLHLTKPVDPDLLKSVLLRFQGILYD